MTSLTYIRINEFILKSHSKLGTITTISEYMHIWERKMSSQYSLYIEVIVNITFLPYAPELWKQLYLRLQFTWVCIWPCK